MAKQVDAVALEMLADKISRIDELEERYDKTAFDQWRTETQLVIEHIFGEGSDKVKTFKRYNGSLGVYWSGEPDYELHARREQAYMSDLRGARSFLKGLQDFLEKIVGKPELKQVESITDSEEIFSGSADHRLHPVIASVSGPLFAHGHYAEAIRAALIEVIDRVKERTGRRKTNNRRAELDGDDLMNQTFLSPDPKLKWSELSTDAERDFQQGMYFLFKGLVFLRNEKGHVNVEQKDKEKAFEYLCFASLLLRQIDEAISIEGEGRSMGVRL